MDDIRVLQLLDQVYFLSYSVPVRLGQLEQANLVPGDLLARLLVHALEDHFVGAAAQLLMEPLEAAFRGLFRHLLDQVLLLIIIVLIIVVIVLVLILIFVILVVLRLVIVLSFFIFILLFIFVFIFDLFRGLLCLFLSGDFLILLYLMIDIPITAISHYGCSIFLVLGLQGQL